MTRLAQQVPACRQTGTDIQNRSYTYNNGNELLSQNGTSFQYDANGNMVSKTDSNGTTSYVYDTENRLVQVNTQPVTGNPQLVTYKYDPFGRRIEKNVNGIITRYVYDREDILFELDGNGNIITEYVHGPGIDEPIAMIKNNQTYYYHADGLGSIIAITDSSGRVVQRYEYDSFGNITYQQDANFVQPYIYTAREYDLESGLYYYRARYYDPKIGRFITQDPIGFAGGDVNLYSYVWQSPVNWRDPEGLQGKKGPKNQPEYIWMPCTAEEEAQCKADCASRGKEYESCRRRYIYSPTRDVLSKGQLSCSCKDPDDCPPKIPPIPFFPPSPFRGFGGGGQLLTPSDNPLGRIR